MSAVRPVFGIACLLAALTGLQTAALAEVCDKMVLVPQNWEPLMGAQSLFVPWPRLVISAIAAGVASLLVWRFELRTTSILISGVLALLALLMFGWAFSGTLLDEVRSQALSEGCYSIGADAFSALVLMSAAVLFALLGRKRNVSVDQ